MFAFTVTGDAPSNKVRAACKLSLSKRSKLFLSLRDKFEDNVNPTCASSGEKKGEVTKSTPAFSVRGGDVCGRDNDVRGRDDVGERGRGGMATSDEAMRSF